MLLNQPHVTGEGSITYRGREKRLLELQQISLKIIVTRISLLPRESEQGPGAGLGITYLDWLRTLMPENVKLHTL